MDNKYIAKKIYSKNTISEISKKISLLGVSSKIDTYTFLNTRLIISIAIFLVVMFISRFGYVLAPILSILFYRLYTYIILDYKIKNRQISLESDALQFFEILTLSLETGRNLQEAIEVTVDSSNGELCNEFKEMLREVKYGKSLTEAMEGLENKIPSDTIKNIILSLTQADLYGSSIIDSLHNQIDYLREKRRMEVKAVISKIPIKISIISVFFFIPLILIIILGPVVLQYLR
ncbi:MAG: type II secretion system F family protein [Bacilli bacterium]|nr:type II secretion system F family protein [Bacilli bacterium]